MHDIKSSGPRSRIGLRDNFCHALTRANHNLRPRAASFREPIHRSCDCIHQPSSQTETKLPIKTHISSNNPHCGKADQPIYDQTRRSTPAAVPSASQNHTLQTPQTPQTAHHTPADISSAHLPNHAKTVQLAIPRKPGVFTVRFFTITNTLGQLTTAILVSRVAPSSSCLASTAEVASPYQNWLAFQSSTNMDMEMGKAT